MSTKMTHPDSKQTIDVDDDSVQTYRDAGWEPKGEPKKSDDK